MECPFCKEEVQEGAVKCKHCQSMLPRDEVEAGDQPPFSYYTGAFRKFAQFHGRARRREYWFFFLFNLLIALALGLLDGMMGTFDPEAGLGVLSTIYVLVVLVPALALTVRRLHDISLSGWWVLVGFVPFIGGIVLLVFMLLDSKPEVNKYGRSPKAIGA